MAFLELKISLKSINSNITCQLCGGYLIDATTVNECLHTFCKSCLVKHLKESNTCPTCLVVIHQRHPFNYISHDRTMQDIVYRLVPNLLQNEQEKERNFYNERGLPFPGDTSINTSYLGKDYDNIRSDLNDGRSPNNVAKKLSAQYPEVDLSKDQYFKNFSSQNDSYDLAIEYLPYRISYSTVPIVKRKAFSDNSRPNNCPAEMLSQKRYLRCSGSVRIHHIKKFLRLKYGIKNDSKIDVIFKDIPLLDDSTIFDLAFISELESKPLNLFYRISYN